MCVYEFYWFDKTEKAHFIGILQENRENLWITRESVLNLGRKVISSVVMKMSRTSISFR
jgi:hypothetical protein